ncbi:MAG: hypothetical protein AB1791_14885 [Chloroflexota bacterium]
MKSQRDVPFGLFFEEPVNQPLYETVFPEYDPITGLSFIQNETGERVPFISQEWRFLATQTGTNTKQIADSEDTDPTPPNPRPWPGTGTVTNIGGEPTD